MLKYLYQPYLPPSHFQGTDALEKFQLITTAYEVSICRHCYGIATLAMYTTRPVGRGGSRGFERTPLLASRRFYIHCFLLNILSALPLESGPLVVSQLLRIAAVQASLVAAMRV